MGLGTGQPMPGGGTGMPTGGPTGTGGTMGSYGNQSVDQWDQAFIAAGNKYGVDPTLLKAMMEIESGGNGNLPLNQCRSDGSCGPMQVKPGIWGNVGSVPEQIEQAAKILGDGVSSGQYPNAEAALFGIYFPTDDVMNGTTQGGYAERVHQLQAQMGSFNPGTGQPATGPGMLPGGPTNNIYTTPGLNGLTGAMGFTNTGGKVAAPSIPTGTIQTTQWGNGESWDTLGQYDATIQAEAAKHNIDPGYIYASMAIESGGRDVCNPDGYHCHVLQMDPANSADAQRLGYDISTNEGQIGYLAAIAEGTAGIGVGNTPEERIMSVYPGAGGSAQHVADYDRDWNSIVQQYHAAGGGAAPLPTSGPLNTQPQIDSSGTKPIYTPIGTQPDQHTETAEGKPGAPPILVDQSGQVVPDSRGGGVIAGPGGVNPGTLVFDDAAANITMTSAHQSGYPNTQRPVVEDDANSSYLNGLYDGAASNYLYGNAESGTAVKYGFKDWNDATYFDTSCQCQRGLYYNYWDWNEHAHTGMDIGTPAFTPYNALSSGTVVCDGNYGSGFDSTGCGAYNDVMHGGTGNITTLHSDFGDCSAGSGSTGCAAIIYGHSNKFADTVPLGEDGYTHLGSVIGAGNPLGISGGENADHIHLEVQLPLNGLDNPWVIVDPEAYYNNVYCHPADHQQWDFCPYGKGA